MSYEAVIGIEIHAELLTATKLFCGCANMFGGEPNTRICPVCTGQPGSLPSASRHAVELALRAGLAFGCEINNLSAHCRKHYFYPDLPKGYQTSQRETPIGVNGKFRFISDGEIKTVRIHQLHLEEDAGKLVHLDSGVTGIDYNRAGVPLIEIVTEPELHSAKEAGAFLEAVRLCLIRTGISDCKMEEGSLRCDVNVSLRKTGEKSLNDRVEMKNINTFSGAIRAIEHEVLRQTEILSRGESVVRETRKWDDEKRESRLMRSKEEAVDYKFMPEPDIPCYILDEKMIEEQKAFLSEDDVSRTLRYKELGVSENDINCIVSDVEMSSFFDECIPFSENPCECAKLLVGDVCAILAKENLPLSASRLSPNELSRLSALIVSGKLNRRSAKKVLQILITDGGSAEKLSERYITIDDEKIILYTVSEVLSNNGKAIADYKSGKEASFMYLMGQCMRLLQGRADADKLRFVLTEELKRRI